MPPKTIYVGMALTEAPIDFREDFQHELKALLRQLTDAVILDFVGLEGGTAKAVFEHDRGCAETADVCVFVVEYPSIGLGMEIAFRHMTGKRMLVFAPAGKRVTRMLTGMCEGNTNAILYRYYTVAEIVKQVSFELEALAEASLTQ